MCVSVVQKSMKHKLFRVSHSSCLCWSFWHKSSTWSNSWSKCWIFQSGSQSGTMSFQSPEDYQETGFPGPEDKRPVKKTIGLQAALSLSPNSLALEEPPAAFTHSVCPSPGSVSCCSRTRTFAYSEVRFKFVGNLNEFIRLFILSLIQTWFIIL